MALLLVCVFLFVSNFGVGGAVGKFLSGVLFGLFGLFAYLLPVLVLLMVLFLISRSSNLSALINFLTLPGISLTDFQNIPEAELPPPDILPLPGESVPAP